MCLLFARDCHAGLPISHPLHGGWDFQVLLGERGNISHVMILTLKIKRKKETGGITTAVVLKRFGFVLRLVSRAYLFDIWRLTQCVWSLYEM